ncbi:MAG: RNA polymerase sigma factor [Oscillospiraceae bacterium]
MDNGLIQNKQQLDILLTKAADGDRTAWADLYTGTKKPLYLFALSVLRNETQAEDALQDTFLRIMASVKTYRAGSNPSAWLFTVARNVCMDALARRGHSMGSDALDTLPAAEATEERITGALDAVGCLQVLTGTEREIILLAVFGGFKQTEIARLLGYNYIKVRSSYGYAVKKLRKFYDGKGVVFNAEKRSI